MGNQWPITIFKSKYFPVIRMIGMFRRIFKRFHCFIIKGLRGAFELLRNQ